MVKLVVCWGTYDTSKPRTRILRDGLRAAGVTVLECHERVWEDIVDKSQVAGVLRRLALFIRWASRYPFLIWRFLRMPRPDLVLVGYPGVLDVIVLCPIARLRNVPIVWDMFVSLYDTVVQDRALIGAKSPWARLLYSIERLAIQLTDVVLLDTAEHARHLERIYGLYEGQCESVWVGVEPEYFQPQEPTPIPIAHEGGSLKVLFYGQFIPLHGIETIVAAARLLREEPIEWLLIGRGQEAPRIRSMLAESPLPRLRWLEWVEYAELQQAIRWADVCLGIFGTSTKAACVIPNKVFQIVAAGRPLITRDSPAVRELVHHSPPCVWLVEPGDPQALAATLRNLQSQPRMTASCHAGAVQRFDPPAIARQFLDMLRRSRTEWKAQ